jgi:hypothetical protein
MSSGFQHLEVECGSHPKELCAEVLKVRFAQFKLFFEKELHLFKLDII